MSLQGQNRLNFKLRHHPMLAKHNGLAGGTSHETKPCKTWTVAEAKARLSEILRLASEEGPRRIGANPRYVVVTEKEWLKRAEPRMPLGRWLVENLPRGYDDLELPDRAEPERPPPFEVWEFEEDGEGK
jgi:hypothetical protein